MYCDSRSTASSYLLNHLRVCKSPMNLHLDDVYSALLLIAPVKTIAESGCSSQLCHADSFSYTVAALTSEQTHAHPVDVDLVLSRARA